MNKTLVIHHSKYGSSKAYGEAIAKTLNATAQSFKSLKNKDLKNADTLIYVAGVYISSIRGLKKLNKKLTNTNINTYIVGVGLGPKTTETLEKLKAHNEKALAPHTNPLYYFCGDFDVKTFSFLHRVMMKMLKKMLKNKADITEDEKYLLNAIENPVKQIDTSLTSELTNHIKE